MWRPLARVLVLLSRRLDADLQEAARLSLHEYGVLVKLSEAPGGQLRMSDLAGQVGLSPSRISRLIDNYAAQGLVTKTPCIDDARGNFATITENGLARLRSAYSAHLASVRHRVVDHLTGVDLPTLAAALRDIEEGL